MNRLLSLILLLPFAANAIRIVLSNDDGWAEKNVRVFFDTLTAAGERVVLSSPAEQQSGSGSSDKAPTQVDSDGCQFNSCPPSSPAYGHNASNPLLNYVNSEPVTSMRYGIQNLSVPLLGGPAQLAIAGPNVGSNLGFIVNQFSGTIGAAVEAVNNGVPAIAFSGVSGEQVGWNTPLETYQTVYADLATNLTTHLIDSGAPYLPSGTFLNVNFGASSSSSCSRASQYSFILTRTDTGVFSSPDVNWCGSTRLPTESSVANASGACYASVSVAQASNKGDANAAVQGQVLSKLKSILSCRP